MCLKNDSVSRQLKAREGGRDGLTPRMVYEGENYKFHVTYNFPFGVVCVCHTKIEHATLTKGNGVPALYMGMAEFHPEGTARFYNPVSERVIFTNDFEVEPTMFLRDSRVISPEIIKAHTTGEGIPDDLLGVDMFLLDPTLDTMDESNHIGDFSLTPNLATRADTDIETLAIVEQVLPVDATDVS